MRQTHRRFRCWHHGITLLFFYQSSLLLFIGRANVLSFALVQQPQLLLSLPHYDTRTRIRSSLRTARLHGSNSKTINGEADANSSNVAPAIVELMSKHDPILLFASKLLPLDVAIDASALYAWCRRLDEICDDVEPDDDPKETQRALDDWQLRLDQLWEGNPTDEMDAALTACILRRNTHLNLNDASNDASNDTSLPLLSFQKSPFRDMIAGMRSDAVEGRRVADMNELEEYAYQVAGTVGLMLLPLLLNNKGGSDNIEQAAAAARDPAICLGKAIQLINILRDASPDAALGRIYLPQDLLQIQGVPDSDVIALKSSPGYRTVVQSVSNRASEFLEKAEEGRSTLPGLGPLFVQVIVELYRGYLDELERREYDNLTASGERVKISTSRKLVASLNALKKVIIS